MWLNPNITVIDILYNEKPLLHKTDYLLCKIANFYRLPKGN